jgi:general secretion pathway protein D
MAEPRTNSLILRAANSARMALARALITQLDQPSDSGPNAASGNIHVVYLKNADATKLAITLRAALTAQSGSATGSTASAPASAMPASSAASASFGNSGGQPSTGGQIQADPSTNALIITAPEPQYRQLRAVIEKLDARRAQVFVESLIAEVSADKAAEFGVQWQGPIGNKGDSNIGLLGTNFKVGGANLISLATQGASGTVAPSSGLNVGVAHQSNGTYVLGFLARFLQSTGDANVLSTPNLLTLDNEEAKIVIGQNVPFVTGQYTSNNTTAGSVNPFQTIERKDVGLTLRVKPQISENGTVKLQIYQEVSRLDPASLNSSTGLITNKRSIESSVLVEDGAIVVLGGLLQDDYGNSQERVPGLGDVPFFGNLFRSESRSRKKTNLMVFLRPVVVRDGASTQGLLLDRYEQMRGAQLNAQPIENPGLPVSGSPVLPAATRKP